MQLSTLTNLDSYQPHLYILKSSVFYNSTYKIAHYINLKMLLYFLRTCIFLTSRYLHKLHKKVGYIKYLVTKKKLGVQPDRKIYFWRSVDKIEIIEIMRSLDNITEPVSFLCLY